MNVMMTFAEHFAESRGAPIDVNGRVVHAMYRREVRPNESFRIAWRKARASPVQGICVKVQGGNVHVAGDDFNEIVLWRDTAPDEDVITCKGKKRGELRIWNCWRNDRGVMQAWVGNSGMHVEELSMGHVRISCNSRTEITFEDLVFELTFGAGTA